VTLAARRSIGRVLTGDWLSPGAHFAATGRRLAAEAVWRQVIAGDYYHRAGERHVGEKLSIS